MTPERLKSLALRLTPISFRFEATSAELQHLPAR